MEECDEDVDFLLALSEEAALVSSHGFTTLTKLPPAVAPPPSQSAPRKPLSTIDANTYSNIQPHVTSSVASAGWKQQQQQQPPSSAPLNAGASSSHTIGSNFSRANISHLMRKPLPPSTLHPPPPYPHAPHHHGSLAAAGGYLETTSGLKVANPIIGSLVVKVQKAAPLNFTHPYPPPPSPSIPLLLSPSLLMT